MKIAFVSLNRERLPDPVVPVGLLYVMANVPPGHELALWDLCFEPDPYAALRARIAAFQPELITLGMRNLQSNDYSGHATHLAYYTRVFELIRAATNAPTVLGGGGFSVMPRQLMQHLRPSYGISGEGEHAFARLVRVLAGNGGALDQIGNLHYFRDTDAAAREPQLISVPARDGFQALDALHPPDRTLIDAHYYRDVGIDSIQTKRGCGLHCNYCTYPLIEGAAVRQRRPEQVVDEWIEARDSRGANLFFIVDSVFNLPPSHAKAVCRELIRRGVTTPWTCYTNPLAYDQELAELMNAAGCAGMEVGSDSGADDVLLRLKKGFTTSSIRAIHERARAVGLPDCHTFILGTPGETLQTVQQTLELCAQLEPFAAILMLWTDDYEALDAQLATERRGLRTEIEQVLREKQRQFPCWIIPALGVNFDAKLFRSLRRMGCTGPLWQHIRLAETRAFSGPARPHKPRSSPN